MSEWSMSNDVITAIFGLKCKKDLSYSSASTIKFNSPFDIKKISPNNKLNQMDANFKYHVNYNSYAVVELAHEILLHSIIDN